MNKVCILGSGPAGVAAGIAAAYNGAKVCIFERDNKPLKTILKTGNGRCNFANTHIDFDKYYNGDFAKQVFLGSDAKGKDPVLNFFQKLGLSYVEADNGMLFPLSNKAETVRNLLLDVCKKLDVEIICESESVNIDFKNFDSVTDATGGFMSGKKMLCPIKTETKYLKNLDNIRAKCKVSLCRAGNIITTETGEVLFRKYGVSGVCVFNLSRYAMLGDVLRIDFLNCANFVGELKPPCTGVVLPAVFDNFSMMHNITSKSSSKEIEHALRNFDLKVLGLKPDVQAQVTRGGYDVCDINPKTMFNKVASRYACGECVDVDGPCGGYNLYWCWLSGIVAGKSASRLEK